MDRLLSRTLKLYNDRILPAEMFCDHIFQRLTEENADQFLSMCPSKARTLLDKYQLNYPADDDDQQWGRMLTFEMIVSLETAEEVERRHQAELQNIRRGIRLFRKWRRNETAR